MRELNPGRLGAGATLLLGLKNLVRNRKRTLITASAVALAVFFIQIVVALMIGIESQSFDNLIYYQTAHAKIYQSEYFPEREELPLDRALTDPASVEAMAAGVPGVAGVAPRLAFQAYLSDGADQIPVRGIGIQVEGSDDAVFRIPQAVTSGSYLQAGQEGILLGSGLAELFDVETGDWLTVLARTRAGAWEALDLPVVGLLGTGNPMIDRTSFMMPLADARRMLMMEGEATEVAVRYDPGAREQRVLAALRTRIDGQTGLDVKSWQEQESDFLALADAKRKGQGVFLGIFVFLALVGVANTMLMAAFERTREVGMLMAMGLRRGGVRSLFLTEGALTGLLGGLLGSLLGIAVVLWLARVGIDFSAMAGDADIGYPVKDFVYPHLGIGIALLIWGTTGLLAMLASLYPAARASRMDPAEALRHV